MADGRFPLLRDLGERAAEGRVEEDRVVAEAAAAARGRGDAALDRAARLEEHLARARERQRAREPRGALRRPALLQQAVDHRELLGIGRGDVGGVSRRVDAGRAVERVDLEARVLGHHQHVQRRRRSTAPSPGRSLRTSGRLPRAPRPAGSRTGPGSRSAGRRARPGFRAACPRSSWPAAGRSQQVADDLALQRVQLADAVLREVEERVQRVASEGIGLGGALHLDEQAAAGLDDVHVHVGAGVLVVGEVEQRLAADDADAGGGDEVADGHRGDLVLVAHLLQRQHERDEAAGDRRRAGAAVGLDDVAVHPDRPLAHLPEPRDRAERSPDQPLDLLRAAE